MYWECTLVHEAHKSVLSVGHMSGIVIILTCSGHIPEADVATPRCYLENTKLSNQPTHTLCMNSQPGNYPSPFSLAPIHLTLHGVPVEDLKQSTQDRCVMVIIAAAVCVMHKDYTVKCRCRGQHYRWPLMTKCAKNIIAHNNTIICMGNYPYFRIPFTSKTISLRWRWLKHTTRCATMKCDESGKVLIHTNDEKTDGIIRVILKDLSWIRAEIIE